MSTHPNAILLLVLKPDDLARKTYRGILEEMGSDYFLIGAEYYHSKVMEDSYDEGNQISAEEGDIVVWNFMTYGYGENIPWFDVVSRKEALEVWAAYICERHKCTSQIYVTANYW